METFNQLGGRWKVKLIYCLKDGPMRYSELRKQISQISEKMLTVQLKELVAQGWIVRKDYMSIPPHTDYTLSEKGESFIPILVQIYAWAEVNLNPECLSNEEPMAKS